MKTVAIILARGGSKGLPNKNIRPFCRKPLITWTIDFCFQVPGIDSVWVSSDSEKILQISQNSGARPILRPESISGDMATSESAWLHAIDYIEKVSNGPIDWVLAPQVTSPLRTDDDAKKIFLALKNDDYDSMFSCSPVEDLFFWQYNNNELESVNYDWRNRKRRQDIPSQFIENGSFYLFRRNVVKNYNNRFGGRIGMVEMEFWQSFEIDNIEDFKMCEAIMEKFILENR